MKLECAECGEKAVILLPPHLAMKNPGSLLTKILIKASARRSLPKGGQWFSLCEKCGHKGLIAIGNL